MIAIGFIVIGITEDTMRISGFSLYMTVLLGIGLTACSSMTIPTIVLRRLNDVGVVYKTTYKQAENAIASVVNEMGCTVRYTSRVPGTVNGENVEEAGSMTIHCQCPGDNRYPKVFGFEIDVDRVKGQPDQRKIRIGIGDFGDKDMALRFHQLLMKKLEYIPEQLPKKSAEALTGSPIPATKSVANEEVIVSYKEVVEQSSSKPVAVEGGMVEELDIVNSSAVATPVQ